MNWKLIAQLSLFGLAMGVATVFWVPSNVEPLGWLVVFVISGYLIATRSAGRRYLHGLLVGVANSVWVTASHILLVESYIANHPREAAMMRAMRLPDSPRLMMALTGPVIGVASGLVLGFFAVVAGRLVAGRSPAA